MKMKSSNFQAYEKCCGCSTTYYQRCYHHIYTQKTRKDLSQEKWNKMPLCVFCHTEVHMIGMTKFADKYEGAKFFLKINGWKFCDTLKKWTHELAEKRI